MFDQPIAGELQATVTTNRPDYTVTVETGKTWVTYEKVAIGDLLILKIKVSASDVEAERTATVTVHVDGGTDVVLNVSQAAYIPPIEAPNAAVPHGTCSAVCGRSESKF